MTNLRDLNLDYGYMGKGEEILELFTLPCLRACAAYDRITSYYSFSSLLALADGIQALYERRGRMRLIIGVHSIPSEIIEASLRRDYLRQEIASVRQDIEHGISSVGDSLLKKNIATLGWMMEDGLLQVKAASMEGDGIFHPKTLLFSDENGDRVVAVGSSNETGSGHGSNFEQLMVVCSWDGEGAVSKQESFFEDLWYDKRPDAVVDEITQELVASISSSLGSAYVSLKTSGAQPADEALKTAAAMPANFFVSGSIPALYQHQERAVIDALSRWPVRVLFADEVGLGKTFEAAATLAYLVKYCGVERVLILTPKAVLQQWQEELAEHFGINAWLYDSSMKAYYDVNGAKKSIGTSNPIGKKAPDIMLMSAQFARGSGKQKSVFERAGAILPDLLILDEAHSARVSTDLSGSKKSTKIYTMLKEFAPQIPHVILATATPMQKESSEYHSMLKLLGLPNAWKKPRAYQTSLALTVSENPPSTADAYTAGKLLRSTVKGLNPSLKRLANDETTALQGLLEMGDEVDNVEIANYVQGNWETLKPAFIKLHPAHLLTVRNTRRSLTAMGYRFPVRNLHAEAIFDSADVQLFYLRVEDYIGRLYFAVERALHPDKKMNVGFVRISYQQRLASSLYSCRESLVRRFDKLSEIKARIESGDEVYGTAEDADSAAGFDDIFYDDAMLVGDEDFEELGSATGEVNAGELMRALKLETAAIATLIAQVNRLIGECGDLKISRAVQLAQKHLGDGDKVLVFSRYTDTVDALVEAFGASDKGIHPFGIYIGQKSIRVDAGTETPVSKSDIKRGLEDGDIPIMFCSDAASEGLNLQAARVLINVDVPWTPARLEQRIGRVARLGQKAEEVEVYNVWYPNSVEAKMYTRIEKRLKSMDIAVGEFPQVVSDKIRDAILSGDEDGDLYELQEIRNSVQTRALSQLWSNNEMGVTTSRYIRNGLIAICDRELQLKEVRGDARCYESASGEVLELRAEEGHPESISYTTLLSARIEYDLDGFSVLNDERGNPAAFAFSGGKEILDHESIVDLLVGEPVSATGSGLSHPKMLPDNKDMSFDSALACEVPPRPSFWPPVM